jgi:hypothetical protein
VTCSINGLVVASYDKAVITIKRHSFHRIGSLSWQQRARVVDISDRCNSAIVLGLKCVILSVSKMVDRTWVSPGQYRRSCSTAISNPANRPRTSMKDEVHSSSNRR